ncbi:MAG: hypothetical protein KDD45_10615, partial [Bdellovibrionales bacterium]|nr:hypothetical protein [Bdellovibrionales bacterium]
MSLKQNPFGTIRSNYVFTLIFCFILSSVSVFSEEELTLDDETPPQTAQKAAESQKKTVSQNKKISKFYSEMLKLYSQKQYSKLTTILWAKIDVLNTSELLLLIKAHYENKDYNDSIRAANLLIAKDDKNEEALTY